MPTACILVPVFICVLLNIVSSMLLDDIYARNANKLSRDTRCQNILRTKNTNIQRFSIAHSPLLPIFAHFLHYSNTFYTGAKNIVEIHFPHLSINLFFNTFYTCCFWIVAKDIIEILLLIFVLTFILLQRVSLRFYRTLFIFAHFLQFSQRILLRFYCILSIFMNQRIFVLIPILLQEYHFIAHFLY